MNFFFLYETFISEMYMSNVFAVTNNAIKSTKQIFMSLIMSFGKDLEGEFPDQGILYAFSIFGVVNTNLY